jgi:tetrapyrrole methylase family protein/MazG family protein
LDNYKFKKGVFTMAKSITVVGLGTGTEQQLTLGIWNKIQKAGSFYLRTEHHPVVTYLKEQGVAFQTFDDLYEQHSTFNEVYESIVLKLIQAANDQQGHVVYAVPGHPMVAEYTVVLLKDQCPAHNITLEILGGESFLDQVFLRLGFDPIEGFQLLDASQLQTRDIKAGQHLIFAQVYDQHVASEVKLSLMQFYPDECEIIVGHALGVEGQEEIIKVPLYELDRVQGYGNLSLIWVPQNASDEVRNRTFERLHEIVGILRSPEGCPWDREQTHTSIRNNLIEETYEVLETIDDDDPYAMCEEMGDLLLQVMLHSQMEEEAGAFDVFDVIEEINEKLIRRHPHVFGAAGANNTDEALQNWDAMKREEKLRKGLDPDQSSKLSGIPRDLPAVMKAVKLQKKAAKVGFDWDQLEDVFAKVQEEIVELKEAAAEQNTEHTKAELGDLLFAVVNIARFMKVDPEEALTLTNRKFRRRFEYIENRLQASGKTFEETNLLEMESWWQEAKRH